MNKTEIFKFKMHDNILWYKFCLGNVSKKFAKDEVNEISLKDQMKEISIRFLSSSQCN